MLSFLLENPWELGATLGLVMFCVLVGWALNRNRLWLHIALVWGVVCLVLPAVNILVKTEREQIQGFFQSMMQENRDEAFAPSIGLYR